MAAQNEKKKIWEKKIWEKKTLPFSLQRPSKYKTKTNNTDKNDKRPKENSFSICAGTVWALILAEREIKTNIIVGNGSFQSDRKWTARKCPLRFQQIPH